MSSPGQQPYEKFFAMHDKTSATDTPITPAKKVASLRGDAPTAPATPVVPEAPKLDALALGKELKKELEDGIGKPSTRRQITRSATMPTPPKTAVPAATAFELYGLEAAPLKKKGESGPGKESVAQLAARNDRNFVKLADALGAMDTRVKRLTRTVDNLVTENSLRAAVRDGRDVRTSNSSEAGSEQDTPTAPNSAAANLPVANSPAASSVRGYDDEDYILQRLEGLDRSIDDALSITDSHAMEIKALEERMGMVEDQGEEIKALERRMPPAALYTAAELGVVVKEQFATIHEARSKLVNEMRSTAAKQQKINDAHWKELQQLKTSFLRKEMAPAAPSCSRSRSPPLLAPGRSVSAASGFRRRSPSPPVQLNRQEYSPPPRSNRRSRSRSPFRRLIRSRSRSPKRFRVAEEPEPEAYIKMGPITLALTLNANATEIFKLHMGTALPKYSLPSDFRAKREGNYLAIILPTMGHASDLCRAWAGQNVEAYRDIKMVISSASSAKLTRDSRAPSAAAGGSGATSSGGTGHRGGRTSAETSRGSANASYARHPSSTSNTRH
ncbi:hypothetical protein B0H17DRAFT_1098405 [Mycena rosella]|uniref:Uncharacterized protein n=1 Tax=Mycena rosella TaxID=1033263 RepID=A0AAD7CRV3_MYCRO|nr:hypothetical protein B0H17DRAFT_1098405 [Mycena rosella]